MMIEALAAAVLFDKALEGDKSIPTPRYRYVEHFEVTKPNGEKMTIKGYRQHLNLGEF